jgi:hypothetical protein
MKWAVNTAEEEKWRGLTSTKVSLKKYRSLFYPDSTDYCIQWPNCGTTQGNWTIFLHRWAFRAKAMNSSKQQNYTTVVQKALGQGMILLFNHLEIQKWLSDTNIFIVSHYTSLILCHLLPSIPLLLVYQYTQLQHLILQSSHVANCHWDLFLFGPHKKVNYAVKWLDIITPHNRPHPFIL